MKFSIGTCLTALVLGAFCTHASARDEPVNPLEVLPSVDRASTTVAIGQPDPALAGHYYLSGVRETGSELLLRADGTFEWYMSYGAVDLSTSGHWVRKRAVVTLIPDRPKSGGELFRPDAREPWNGAAELGLRKLRWSEHAEEIRAQCPLLDMPDLVSTPVASMLDDRIDPQAPTRATNALALANAARSEVEQTARLAFAAGHDTARMAEAKAAMLHWQEARSEAQSSYAEAHLPMPQINRPHLPDQCTIPPEPESDTLPASEWPGGIAVVVGDPLKELRMSGVRVKFGYSDGHSETGTTSNGGWAFAPLRGGQADTSLDLSMADQRVRPFHLAIAPIANGIQTIIINTDILTRPPFDQLELALDGSDLVMPGDRRGRYSRQ